MLQLYIITGLSGAGKTFANKCFEDAGFYCVDNLPPALIPNFVELCTHSSRKIERISLVLDIRGREFFDDLFKSLDSLNSDGYKYYVVFLDASDSALVRRFKEARRRPPLSPENGTILDGIEIERHCLKQLRERADYYIDTSTMSPWTLKQEILSKILGSGEKIEKLGITVISFGYKYGVPLEADFVFDVRFLPNPYYRDDLKDLSGESEAVQIFVMNSSITQEYFTKLTDLVLYTLPHCLTEGKANLTVGIGCTGGRHRSVVLAKELGKTLQDNNYISVVYHRDLGKL